MESRGPIYRLPPVTQNAVFLAKDVTETVDWGLRQFGVPDQWSRTMGAGVKVAILDTGIDDKHPDLAGSIVAMQNFSRSPFGAIDRNGHGTHCAGIVAARKNGLGVIGVAPEVSLAIGKVLGDDGSGYDVDIARGIRWAIDQKVDVISGSFGSPVPSPAQQAAIDSATAAGIFVIIAAGNDGQPDSVGYPGKLPNVVAVAATDQNGNLADFSSRGPEVDIAAPGVDILSTWPGGRYSSLSGTSMATPFVSGVVALMVAHHRAPGAHNTDLRTVDDLLDHLKRTARDAGQAGRDDGFGWGLIDPAKLLAEDTAAPAPSPTPAPAVPWSGRSIPLPNGAVIHFPAKPGDQASLKW